MTTMHNGSEDEVVHLLPRPVEIEKERRTRMRRRRNEDGTYKRRTRRGNAGLPLQFWRRIEVFLLLEDEVLLTAALLPLLFP
jgi:hypothetical protein